MQALDESNAGIAVLGTVDDGQGLGAHVLIIPIGEDPNRPLQVRVLCFRIDTEIFDGNHMILLTGSKGEQRKKEEQGSTAQHGKPQQQQWDQQQQ
jgi:hypothetical protein